MYKIWALIGITTCLSVACGSIPDFEPDKPNVIFILTDDQGWGDIQAHGNDYLSTPTLDAMKRESASFNRFYVSPLCAPTRASFLTGRYHLKTGTVSVSRGMERMKGSEVTLAEILKDHGYATGCFGKWHNGENYPENPQGQGFEEFFGFTAGHWNNYFDTDLQFNGRTLPTKGYITDVLTDAALDFMQKHQSRPFFCYIPYNAPHSPFQVPDEYFDKYKAMGLDDKLASVYGMCENLDDNIQRILNKLADLEIEENTIVIFATDNGPNGERFNGGLKGWKGQVDEGGVKVPMFIRWQGKITSGKEIEQLSSHIDLLPTVLELLDIQAPEDLALDGISLAPALLEDQVEFPKRNIFTHVNFMTELLPYPGAIRNQQYLLTLKQSGVELYDLQQDPEQQHQLQDSLVEVRERLEDSYQQWFQSVTADIDTLRPTMVGGDNTANVLLTVQEATFTPGLEFFEGHGWANDWLVNWDSDGDSIQWLIEVKETCSYRIWMEYTVPEKDKGARVAVSAGAAQSTGIITKSFDPEYLPSPDRVPRVEVYEKSWARLDLGEIPLHAGEQKLTLKALNVPGEQVCELRRLVLERVE